MDERERFEAWWTEKYFEAWWTEKYSGYKLSRRPTMGGYPGEEYADPRVDLAWLVWQARADLAAERERQKDERIAELREILRKERNRIAYFLNENGITVSAWLIFNAAMDEREAPRQDRRTEGGR